MDLWQSLNGSVTMEYVSADNSMVLTSLQTEGITFSDVRFVDELTVRFCIQRQYIPRISEFACKKGDICKVLGRQGLYWKMRGLMKRPVLLAGILIMIILTMYLPARILFYRIEGNTSVPDHKILELVWQNGIPFGTQRRDIRSEKVKNTLLQALPELEWAGINTSGCVATISVRERQNVQSPVQKKGVSSIVATRDGVIQEITATAGTPVVKIGQAVKEGQVLISGYTNCGISVRAERSSGEIFATTNRNLTLVMPGNTLQRGEVISETKKYALIIGKNRINLSQDSGNLDTVCVKIYEQNYLTLPGGFQLPIAIVTETRISYETINDVQPGNENNLSDLAGAYLQEQMTAGKILSRQERLSQEDEITVLHGQYACLEMIGRERNEEIIKP